MEKSEYKTYFFMQWENVIGDFNKMSANHPLDVEYMNHWYKTRVFCWGSVTESERMILDDLKQPEFADQLRQALNSFHFTKEQADPLPSAGPMLAGSVAAGIALGVVLKMLLHRGWFLTIAGGVLLTIIGCWFALDRRSAAETKRNRQLCDRYATQLKEYAKKLEQVFTKYGMK